jgi:hypothetical protein
VAASGPIARRGELTDTEDHELGWVRRRDTDQTDESAVVDIVLRHRRAIAADEVRLLGLRAHQRTGLPDAEEERFDRLDDALPERLIIRFEYDPLRAAVDRVLQEDE